MFINYTKSKVSELVKQQTCSHLFEMKCPDMLIKTQLTAFPGCTA